MSPTAEVLLRMLVVGWAAAVVMALVAETEAVLEGDRAALRRLAAWFLLGWFLLPALALVGIADVLAPRDRPRRDRLHDLLLPPADAP